jgi:hypothetical protein
MNRLETYISDVFVGVFLSTLGGPGGYLVFLIICCIRVGKMPNGRDLGLFPLMLFFGFLLGVVLIPIFRALIGTIRAAWVWIIGCFLAGAVLSLVMLFILFYCTRWIFV